MLSCGSCLQKIIYRDFKNFQDQEQRDSSYGLHSLGKKLQRFMSGRTSYEPGQSSLKHELMAASGSILLDPLQSGSAGSRRNSTSSLKSTLQDTRDH
jgi:hypothetical protein